MTRLTFVGDEYMPTYSPSGDQLAWVADWGGQNHIVIGDGDAQNSRNLGVGSQPDFSPDGRYIVFSTPRADGQWWIAIMRTDGTELRYQRPGRNPSWSPDHHVVVFENDGNIYKMTPWDPASMALVAAGDAYQTPADPAFRQASTWYPRDSSIQDPPGPPAATDNEMLEWYTPRLRFDTLESYRADSPATLTDTYVSGATANYLKRSTQKIVAASDPALRYDDLSLNFLAPTYPGKAGSAATSDFIDENNGYLADAQRMHARSAYANRVVGRVVRYADAIILQYWLWYYYNPKTYLTIGAHEGDWEMVQVRLDRATLQPTLATFSQHNGGETCGWLHVERDANNHPIVYVAEGSHASYFSAGYHFNGGANDTAGGDGEEVARPTLIDVTTSPNWLRWPGHWGGSDSSPAGPMQQGGIKWSDPQAWGYGADACSEESRVIDGAAAASARRKRTRSQGAASVNTRKMPEIRARLSGNTIIIEYRSAATDSRSPATLLTSLRTHRADLTPLTTRTTIRRPSGVIRRTIPERMGRVSLYVAVEFPGQGRTKVMRVPLR